MLLFFFFNDTATTEIYTLSLHDALPISAGRPRRPPGQLAGRPGCRLLDGGRGRHLAPGVVHGGAAAGGDRKRTRLNSSHAHISYAGFCLEKKKKIIIPSLPTSYHYCQHL